MCQATNATYTMESKSELEKVIRHLEHERKALLRTSFVLARKRDNITRYLEILAVRPAHGNAAKRRAQNMLGPIKERSVDLFVLCALATTQQILGTVKWMRDEIDAVLQWWEKEEQPLASLRSIRRQFGSMVYNTQVEHGLLTRLSADIPDQSVEGAKDMSSNSEITQNPSSVTSALDLENSPKDLQTGYAAEQDRVVIKAAWLIDALKEKEDISLVVNRSKARDSSIELPEDIKDTILKRRMV